ncbi:MAG: CYTH domain-containing protein [Anaerorhabdus sp.]
MKSHLEIEYKTLVTKKQLEALIQNFPQAKIIAQTNYYFDSVPSLKERKMSCRIRQIKEDYLFTLKIKLDDGTVNEIEFPTPSLSLEDPQIQSVLTSYDIPPLELKGQLHTKRHQCTLEKGLLCLDINSYGECIDYEVEYELNDGIGDDLEFFVNFLHSFSIDYIPNPIGKFSRCLQNKKSN